MSGYVIRQLNQNDGRDDLAVVMIIEEEELGKNRSTESVIIPESTETGKRLWAWAQRDNKEFSFSPAAFGQPAGIKATRMQAFTETAQRARASPFPENHCIVSINGINIILANEDLFVVTPAR